MLTASGLPVRAASMRTVSPTRHQDGVGVFTGFQQLLDHDRVAVGRGEREWRGAEPIGGLYVRARANQQIGGFEIAGADGPVERCCSIGLRRVHVHLLLQERVDGGAVPGLG